MQKMMNQEATMKEAWESVIQEEARLASSRRTGRRANAILKEVNT
jgi:hypothetical protein